MVKLHEQTEKTINDTLNMPKESPKMNTPYKDALVNARSTMTPQTPSQCKIMNCINIKAQQVLIEYKAEAYDRFFKNKQLNVKPESHIREAINTWLNSPEDQNGPLPMKVAAKSVLIFGKTHMMIEMNSSEAASWMCTHPEWILGKILKCPIKVLNWTYVVVTRFVPVGYNINATNLKELEDKMELPSRSIPKAGWIKDPAKHAKNQQYANMKISAQHLKWSTNWSMDWHTLEEQDSVFRRTSKPQEPATNVSYMAIMSKGAQVPQTHVGYAEKDTECHYAKRKDKWNACHVVPPTTPPTTQPAWSTGNLRKHWQIKTQRQHLCITWLMRNGHGGSEWTPLTCLPPPQQARTTTDETQSPETAPTQEQSNPSRTTPLTTSTNPGFPKTSTWNWHKCS